MIFECALMKGFYKTVILFNMKILGKLGTLCINYRLLLVTLAGETAVMKITDVWQQSYDHFIINWVCKAESDSDNDNMKFVYPKLKLVFFSK